MNFALHEKLETHIELYNYRSRKNANNKGLRFALKALIIIIRNEIYYYGST